MLVQDELNEAQFIERYQSYQFYSISSSFNKPSIFD